MAMPSPQNDVRMLMKQKPTSRAIFILLHEQRKENHTPLDVSVSQLRDLQERSQLSLRKGNRIFKSVEDLKTCVSNGDEQHLIAFLRRPGGEKRFLGLVSQNNTVLSVTSKERAMYGYLKLIIIKSLPLSVVEYK